jgi:hypothetical protein
VKLVLAPLSRPLTVVVALIAIALCVFPIYVAQPYGGMDSAQAEAGQ